MNKKIIVLSIVVLILCARCSDSKIKTVKSLPIFDLTTISKTSIIKLSDLDVKDIDYISLETNDTSFLAYIGKIIVSDSDIYIEDYPKAIIRFAKDGKFKNHIGKRGRGPGEFNYAYDFLVDSDLRQVFVMNGTRFNRRLNVYTLSGKFIKSFLIPDNIETITCINNMILGYRANIDGTIDTSLVLINCDGLVMKEFPNKYPYNEVKVPRGLPVEIVQYKFNNQLYIKEIYSDTVFVLDNLNFNPSYILDFGKKTLTPEVRGEMNSLDDLIHVSTQHSIVRNLFETNKFIYAEFSLEEHLYTFINFKNRDEHLLLNMEEGIENDIDGGPNIWLKTTIDDNTIISWINAFELKTHVASEAFKNSIPKYPAKKKKLEQLANCLDDNDNPILMILELKE